MPWLLARLVVALVWLAALPALAAPRAADEAVLLDDASPTLTVEGDVLAGLDEGAHATVDMVASGNFKLAPLPANHHFALTKFDALWIKLRVLRPPSSQQSWRLSIPLPYVDTATLYQRDASGKWIEQQAGDALAHADWSVPGLHPDFEVQLSGSKPQDLYLQIRNFQPISVPMRLATVPARQMQRLCETLALGLILGALLCLSALSVLRLAEHRNRVDGWAALYGFLLVCVVAQVNGVMNLAVWPTLPLLGNMATSILPTIAVGCTLLFLRQVFGLSMRFYWYDRLMAFMGWGTLVSVVTVVVVDRFVAEHITNVFVLAAYAVSLGATMLAWKEGSHAGRWLTLALIPQILALMYMLAESMGWVPAFWPIRYLSSLGVALALPVLLYLLSNITHDRKELVVRANHLPTQDALTGLLTLEVFQQHLEESVQRAIEHREPLALVVVRLTNHDHIRQTFGDTTAEQCLLRAVVKVQRILRDVDPAGRVGTCEFGLLMEGIKTRDSVTERMVQLIGSGLIPVPGLVPEVTLHFQAACVLLHEIPVPPDIVLDELHKLLAEMSPRTRRPVRFLEAVPTEASALPGGDTVISQVSSQH